MADRPADPVVDQAAPRKDRSRANADNLKRVRRRLQVEHPAATHKAKHDVARHRDHKANLGSLSTKQNVMVSAHLP